MKNRIVLTVLVVLSLATVTGAAQAAELPSDLKQLVGTAPRSAADLATQDVLQLNTSMFDLYGDTSKISMKNIRANHPIILGLFSGAGGRLILYRPGMAPLDAPSVPISYQLMKAVAHSTMAISVVVLPYLDNAADQSWRGSMLAYRSRMKSALDSVGAMPIQEDWRDNNRSILQNNIAFMDDCLAKGVISLAATQAFAKAQGPYLRKNVAWAAEIQVAHWMGVLTDWKKMIGADWDKTYAASNTIYVTRQNNILYSILAQFFGPEAINSRLMLIETVSFTTTPEDMLDLITRIVADRSVGALFFGNYYLMDYELMGGNARAAIVAESAKRGMTPFLPPLVPWGSKQWPMLVTPGPGPATLADLP